MYHNSTFEHTCAGARLHVWSDGISIGIWGTRNEAIYISGRWLLYSDDQMVPWNACPMHMKPTRMTAKVLDSKESHEKTRMYPWSSYRLQSLILPKDNARLFQPNLSPASVTCASMPSIRSYIRPLVAKSIAERDRGIGLSRSYGYQASLSGVDMPLRAS